MSDSISLESYINLLDRERIIPKIIETNAEYEQFLAIVEKLMSRKKIRTLEETALFRLLVKLIRDYEEEMYSLKEWSQTTVE
jgi:HTH-type transcriptional regulator / antitoxin HigA